MPIYLIEQWKLMHQISLK